MQKAFPSMSALGQKRTFREARTMSALPLKADIQRIGLHWFLTERLRSQGEHKSGRRESNPRMQLGKLGGFKSSQ